VSLWDRFGPKPGSSRLPLKGDVAHKKVAELSDEELEAELVRRRRARAVSRSEGGPIARESERDNPERKQLIQYYANLELAPFASMDEVKRAYKELVHRYHPDKHAGDPERQKTANELLQSLTKAYDGLIAYFEKR
jgi:DnaJ-domain-containing protein 1